MKQFPRWTLVLSRSAIFYVCLIALLFSCQKEEDKLIIADGEDPLRPQAAVSTNVVGIVMNELGKPLQGVEVIVQGESSYTREDGIFVFSHIQVPGNRFVVICKKDGYFPAVKAATPVKDKNTSFTLYLMTDEVTHIIDASAGGIASLENGSSVQFPSEAFVNDAGEPYAGRVKVSLKYLDPSLPAFGALVPGGDMMAIREDESTSILYSYGILRVKLSDSESDALQLAPGKTAHLTFAIPEQMTGSAPAEIPLWYFDEEKGVWLEDGRATKEGDKYTGTVSHFTDWNADEPKDRATVIGEVVDCGGSPIIAGDVFVGQSSSDLGNGTSVDYTNSNSGFRIGVPAETPLMVMVPNPVSLSLTAKENAHYMVMVPVPPLSAGQVYDVGKVMTHPCPASAKGKFKTKEGDEVVKVNLKILQVKDGSTSNNIVGNSTTIFNPPADFNFNLLPAEVIITMTASTKKGLEVIKTFETQGAGETVDLGEISFHGEFITLSGVVSCQNTPVNGAAIRLVWEGGSETTTSNSLGVFAASLPPDRQISMTISHEQRNAVSVFRTPAAGVYQVGAVDICAHRGLGENSFILNGGGFNNAERTLQPARGGHLASYQEPDDLTLVLIVDESDTLSMSFQFIGKSVGKRSGDEVLFGLVARKVDGKWKNYTTDEHIGGTLEIDVTNYGDVNERVEGNFNGLFVDEQGIPVEIKGKFSTIRTF